MCRVEVRHVEAHPAAGFARDLFRHVTILSDVASVERCRTASSHGFGCRRGMRRDRGRRRRRGKDRTRAGPLGLLPDGPDVPGHRAPLFLAHSARLSNFRRVPPRCAAQRLSNFRRAGYRLSTFRRVTNRPEEKHRATRRPAMLPYPRELNPRGMNCPATRHPALNPCATTPCATTPCAPNHPEGRHSHAPNLDPRPSVGRHDRCSDSGPFHRTGERWSRRLLAGLRRPSRASSAHRVVPNLSRGFPASSSSRRRHECRHDRRRFESSEWRPCSVIPCRVFRHPYEQSCERQTPAYCVPPDRRPRSSVRIRSPRNGASARGVRRLRRRAGPRDAPRERVRRA